MKTKIRTGQLVQSGDIKGKYRGTTIINGKKVALIENEWSPFKSTTAVDPSTLTLIKT